MKTVLDYEIRKITSTKVIEVIEVETRKGDGTEEKPVYCETQYWTKDGRFIGALPPHNTFNRKEVIQIGTRY